MEKFIIISKLIFIIMLLMVVSHCFELSSRTYNP